MIRLKTIRLEQSEDGALGVLLFDNEIFCMTLEPDSGDASRFQIPAGVYPLKHFNGRKWKNTLEIIVPYHTALLFHSGNVEKHSTGCVILGAEVGKLKGDRAILNSGRTYKRFQRDVVPNIRVSDQIEIVDFFFNMSPF